MANSSYTVTGMTCVHCVSAVTEEVLALDGVTDVKVDLAGGMVIESSEKPPLAKVVEAVAEAGDYTVVEA